MVTTILALARTLTAPKESVPLVILTEDAADAAFRAVDPPTVMEPEPRFAFTVPPLRAYELAVSVPSASVLPE